MVWLLPAGRTWSEFAPAREAHGDAEEIANAVARVAEEIRRRSVEKAGKPFGLVIHDHAVRRQHLSATRCSLAQHISRRTGIDHFHQSPTFSRPYRGGTILRQEETLPAQNFLANVAEKSLTV